MPTWGCRPATHTRLSVAETAGGAIVWGVARLDVGNLGFTAERASRRSPGKQVMLCAVVLMTARRTVRSHSRPSSRCSDKETYLPVGRYRVPDRLTAPSLARFATTASGSARGNTRPTRAFR